MYTYLMGCELTICFHILVIHRAFADRRTLINLDLDQRKFRVEGGASCDEMQNQLYKLHGHQLYCAILTSSMHFFDRSRLTCSWKTTDRKIDIAQGIG